MQTEPTLSPIQQRVIDQLAQGDSITAAAQATGVHRNTIANWRRDVPTFNRALDEAVRERAIYFQEQLGDLIPKAIEVLSTILHNESASPSIHLRAAMAVLKLSSQPTTKQPPEPVVRPELAEALEAKIQAVREQHNQIRKNLHNSAQQPIRPPTRRTRPQLTLPLQLRPQIQTMLR